MSSIHTDIHTTIDWSGTSQTTYQPCDLQKTYSTFWITPTSYQATLAGVWPVEWSLRLLPLLSGGTQTGTSLPPTLSGCFLGGMTVYWHPHRLPEHKRQLDLTVMLKIGVIKKKSHRSHSSCSVERWVYTVLCHLVQGTTRSYSLVLIPCSSSTS